jgi:NADH-quinone oxidoreductase subunit L
MEHRAHELHAHGSDPQDMRNMGGLRGKLPITFVTFLIGALSLAGVPPLAGFWSKDEVLLAALHGGDTIVVVLLSAAALMTAFYAGRQLIMVFFGRPRTEDAMHAKESGTLMTAPLVVLALGTVIAGVINLPGSLILKEALEPAIGAEETVAFSIAVAGLYTVEALIGLGLAWLVYRRAFAAADAPDPLARFGPLYRLSLNKWYLDDIYNAIIVKPFYAISTVCAQVLDVGVIDGIVNGLGRLARGAGGSLRRVETGFVRMYGLVMLLGVVAVVAYLVLTVR